MSINPCFFLDARRLYAMHQDGSGLDFVDAHFRAWGDTALDSWKRRFSVIWS